MYIGRRLVLALSLAAAAAIGSTLAGPPRSADVPPGAAAHAVVRFGEFYRSRAGQAALKQLQKADTHALPELERALGVPLAHVETVTAVLPSQTDRNSLFSAVLTVDLNTRHDPAELVKNLQEPGLGPTGLPSGTFPFKDTVEATFTVASDRRFTVFTTERARREYAELWLHRNGQHPFARDNRPLIAIAGRMDNLAAALGGAGYFLSLQRPEFRPLAEATGFTARTELNGALRIRIEFRFPELSSTIQAVKVMEPLRRSALAYLGLQTQQLQYRKDALGLAANAALTAAVRAATVERAGATVVVKAELDPEAVAANWARGLALPDQPLSPKYAPNHLRLIGLAMHTHSDTVGHLPPPAICDATGKPLLSWRVALLPYLGQGGLYRHFHLNEPWDSDHNKKLLARMPEVYRLAPPRAGEADPSEKWHTHFRVFVGNGAAFEPHHGMRFPVDFPDGTSNTILVAVASESVPWTKPDELPFDPKKPPPPLRRSAKQGPLVLLADGAARRLSVKIKPQSLRLLIIRNDGLPVPQDAFDD